MLAVTDVADLKTHTGEELGVSEWHQVTQEVVDAFADATGDDQFIHVDPERAPSAPLHGKQHSSTTPASASAARTPTAARRSRSAATSRRRRSKRSLNTPAKGSATTCGSVHAKPTSARAPGRLEMSYTSQAMATR
jgi:MaoC dehydratase-like protein